MDVISRDGVPRQRSELTSGHGLRCFPIFVFLDAPHPFRLTLLSHYHPAAMISLLSCCQAKVARLTLARVTRGSRTPPSGVPVARIPSPASNASFYIPLDQATPQTLFLSKPTSFQGFLSISTRSSLVHLIPSRLCASVSLGSLSMRGYVALSTPRCSAIHSTVALRLTCIAQSLLCIKTACITSSISPSQIITSSINIDHQSTFSLAAFPSKHSSAATFAYFSTQALFI